VDWPDGFGLIRASNTTPVLVLRFEGHTPGRRWHRIQADDAWRCCAAPGASSPTNQTEGSSYERPTRWVADVAVAVPPHIHAVQRSRVLCAQALGYAVPAALHFGLAAQGDGDSDGVGAGRCVALVHGTSRDDKLWPEDHWLALGRRLIAQGCTLGLPHGSDAEQARSERMARALGPQAQVWPRLDLGALADRLATCAGVVGVDSGLSHIAVALDLPHVQIYNFDTAWRTGPVDALRQRSVFARPAPGVDAVWQAWQQVSAA
jgi:heptosyltransferase-1